MKNRIIILTAVLLFAMSLTAFAQGGILDRARQILDAIDNTGSTQTQQPQQPTTQQPTNTNTQSTNQQPTLDKLTFVNNTNRTAWTARPVNNWITGAVVIPASYEGKPVTEISTFRDITGITSVVIPDSVSNITSVNGYGAFRGCTGLTSFTFGAGVVTIGSNHFRDSGLTSVTIPATVTSINQSAFQNCTNLTSVTFMGQTSISSTYAFDGDLRAKYLAASGGPGTYTRTAGGTTWTKQSSIAYTPTPTPAPVNTQPAANLSIDGIWRSALGNVFSIYDGKAVFTEIIDRTALEAEKRGHIGIGSSSYRNIRSTGNSTWTAQAYVINTSTYAGSWSEDVTFTMSPDGRTMQLRNTNSSSNTGGSGTWTRIQ